MNLRRLLFWCYFTFFMLLSFFTILAPRPFLARLHFHLWSWVLLIPVVWWLWGYVRTLYRGGE